MTLISSIAQSSSSLVARVVVVAAMVSAGVVVPHAHAGADHDPVVFVHGYGGNGDDWDKMRSRFMSDGYAEDQLFAFDYDSDLSNVATADRLAAYVAEVRQETGSDRVDVVTHSMGGLNSRYWLKFLGGTEKVDDWVSLAGPNHGSHALAACNTGPCREMHPGSAFLNGLNAGDETPDAVDYGTFWSPCDLAIVPPESTRLEGAVNTAVGCRDHLALLTDEDVYTQVRDFVS